MEFEYILSGLLEGKRYQYSPEECWFIFIDFSSANENECMLSIDWYDPETGDECGDVEEFVPSFTDLTRSDWEEFTGV